MITEFKEIIEGDYGITNIQSYDEYKKKCYDNGVSQTEIDKLSPDNINSSSFWEYIEKNPELAKDAIAFGAKPYSNIDTVNQQNFNVACSLSIFNYVLMYKDVFNAPILDIGAGYGMLKDFVKNNTKLDYVGVDVYPKIDNVLKVGSDGSTLPDNILLSKFLLVVSTNVFQHLSIRQRRHYYEQIKNILVPIHGIFSFSTVCNVEGLPKIGFKCKENDKHYVCHYGQYTEIQDYSEVVDDLSKHFIILSSNRRMPYDFTFHCQPINKL